MPAALDLLEPAGRNPASAPVARRTVAAPVALPAHPEVPPAEVRRCNGLVVPARVAPPGSNRALVLRREVAVHQQALPLDKSRRFRSKRVCGGLRAVLTNGSFCWQELFRIPRFVRKEKFQGRNWAGHIKFINCSCLEPIATGPNFPIKFRPGCLPTGVAYLDLEFAEVWREGFEFDADFPSFLR